MGTSTERPFRFNLMTFNVWGKFNWPHREKPLESFFSLHKPDVLLLQEASPEILQLIDKSLISHSRIKDEKLSGWFCEGNIYWNRQYFDLVEYGAELFKDIKPNTSSPHRRLFWVKLQLIGTSKTIVVATAHLTYQQDILEIETAHNPRIEQSQRIAKFLNDTFPSQPIFFAGDLNDPIHPSLVFGKAGYTDPFDDLSLAKMPTYPYGISTEDEPEQVLDFIFAKKVSNVRTLAAHVVKYVYKDFKVGEWPTCSDHYPLQAVYELL